MPIDTSMYQVPQNNILGQLGQLQALDNASEQNKLLKQEQQLRGIAIPGAQVDLYNQRLGLISQKLAEVYGADNGNPSRKHLVDGVSDLLSGNPQVFDKNFAAQALSDMPSEAEVAKNPNAVKQWLVSKAVMTERGRAALQPHLPNVQLQDYGPGKVGVDMNPISNPRLPGTRIVNGLPVSDAASRETIGYATAADVAAGRAAHIGDPIQGTKQQFMTRAQGGNPNPAGGMLPAGAVVPGGSGQPMPMAPDAASVTAATSPANAAPAAANAAPAAAARPPAAPEGIAVPVGAAEANTSMAQGSADQAKALQVAATGVKDRKAKLATLEDLASKFEGGPLAKTLSKGAAAFNQVSPISIGKESVAAQEEFAKISAQLANDYRSAAGSAGSHGDLVSAIAANPSDALSKLGGRRIIQMLKGSEDFTQAQYTAWKAYEKQHGAASFGDFINSKEYQSLEPRAHQLQYMDAKEAKAYLHEMSPAEQEAVLRAYHFANKRGYLKPGQGTDGK